MTSANWRAAGAALQSLDRLSVLLVVGDAPVSLAAATRGATEAVASTRRVAIFDLAGAFGLHDYDGLIAAFRDGRSLNALARPLSDGDEMRFVVPRGPGDLDDEFAQHERWPRLVRGFRDTGALLIIAAPADAPGLETIAALSDAAVYLLERDDQQRFVSWPPSDADLFDDVAPPQSIEVDERETIPAVASLRSEHVPADFDLRAAAEADTLESPVTGDYTHAKPAPPAVADPAPTAAWAPLDAGQEAGGRKSPPPPLVRITPPSSMTRIRARRRIGWAALGLLLVLSVSGWYWSRERAKKAAALPGGQTAAAVPNTSTLPDSAFTLPTLVNPEDSARASAWGVELLTTNDRADAVGRLADNTTLAAATVSPVLLGADGGTWYKVVVGAFVDRTGAEYLRATLRQGGALDADAGVIARAPYSLRLEGAVPRDAAKARVVRYVARGVAAYALLDEGALANVYVGAFTSPDQAVILLAELRTAGFKPELAYRVGRTF